MSNDIWIILFAVLINSITHAVRDTLHHHWHRSIFARFGERSYFGPADQVWLRRYTDDTRTVRRWGAWQDGFRDAWHLAQSIQYGTWVVCATTVAGLALGYAVVLWAVGLIVFSILYDHILLT